MRSRCTAVLVVVGALFLSPDREILSANRTPLSPFLVLGDSIPAGFQNFSLLDVQQQNSAAALIAAQARIALDLPLVPYPGIPNVLMLVSPGPPPVVEPVPGPPPAFPRVNPLVQATNLAVPGHTVADAIGKRPTLAPASLTDVLTNVVLGFPTPFGLPGPSRSQLETAVALAPNLILLWIGNNDAIGAAVSGDPTALTPLASFAAAYEHLTQSLAATNAQMVFVNIPDVTLAPFFTSVPTLAAQTGLPATAIVALLGIGPGDLLRPGALPIAFAILSNQIAGPLPSMCPSIVPGDATLVPCVLSATDAAAIRSRVAAYNRVIADRAARWGAAYVDIAALVANLSAHGYSIREQILTTAYLGGLFSLDGLHPSYTGHAILANEILDQMKRQLQINLPKVNVAQIAKDDPLVIGQ